MCRETVIILLAKHGLPHLLPRIPFAPGNYYQVSLAPISGNSASDPTVYACSTYSTATANTAILWSGDSLSDWIVHSGNVYKTDGTPTVQHRDASWASNKNYTCVVGGDSMYIPCLSLGAVDAAGEMYYNPSTDTLYIYPYIAGDPDTSGHVVKASGGPCIDIYSVNRNHFKFFGLGIRMGWKGAIWFDPNINADSNYFEYCNIAHGLAQPSNNSCIIGSWSPGAGAYVGNVFRNDTIYSATCDVNNLHDEFAGCGILMYGAWQWIIDSCYFKQIPGAGVYAKGSTDTARGVRVSYSTFDGTENTPWGGQSFCATAVLFKCAVFCDSVYGCIIKNCTYETAGYSGGAIGLRPGECATPLNYGGHFFCNNTLYNCHRFLVELSYGAEPDSQMTVKYNVFYKVPVSGSYFVFGQNVYPDTADCEIDSNYWYDPTYAFDFYDGSAHNWTDWQDTLLYDVQGYNADPGLDNPAGNNFARSGASGEMNRTYGGRTWTIFGAVQPATESSPGPTRSMFLK